MRDAQAALAGKIVLITGASSGIGAGAAQVFADQGATVVLTARREKPLRDLVAELEGQGAEASYRVVDVRSDDEVRRLVESVVECHGRLDAAFNNAGVGLARSPMHLLDDDAYDMVMETNVRGVWNCMRHELRAMIAGGTGGAIVNTSSVGGMVASSVGAPYIASKHAVIGLTKAAAVEYAEHGIRVNAIAPGLTRSEMTDDWFTVPGTEQRAHRSAPQQRIAEAVEVAEAAAWLCSDKASFVTGATLAVDGGRTAW
ncbi:SDR family NAD(P)-dependent oxidoreductase [Streptomyces beijiangensis]|uniref:Glucose 1-dehydrogenase n=1 Tax=Streptomyces beijiangensis TaxID=163361 RepID=A0A939F4G5_9ACTN|nr:glucose 1-dehydrogenase [Streptomyces beijiangensis]MBO0512376.1 glucose 1-dehydrogenase [Streptomyces beijiangensis]